MVKYRIDFALDQISVKKKIDFLLLKLRGEADSFDCQLTLGVAFRRLA